MRTLAEAASLLPRGRPAESGLSRSDLLRVTGWASDVLRELSRLHDRGLFHGEVSPPAIRIGAKGASLASPEDVKAATEYRDPNRTRQLLREPGAAARPEHDVYGVGASLFAVLEGGPPALGMVSPLTRAVPPALATIVYRAMADGSGRYPGADVMRADLDRLVRLAKDRDLDAIQPWDLPSYDGGAVRAPEALAPYRPRARSRRREIAARTVVLLLLVAGGIATMFRARAGNAADPVPPPPGVVASSPRPGIPGLLDEWRNRIADRLAAAGERFDPLAVPLVVVSDVSVPANLGWPVHPSAHLNRRVRSVLHEGVTSEEVRAVLLAAVGEDTLPAVLWLTLAPGGATHARLYYSGLALTHTVPGKKPSRSPTVTLLPR